MTPRPIAIFDLDGTLTTRDSFASFLLTFGRRRRLYAALSMFPLRVAGYLLRVTKDVQLKQRLLESFFGGVSRSEIREHADWFCREWLPRHRHPVGIPLLQEHLERNHRVVLLSASPDLYVPDIAAALGIRETICTRVEFAGEACTGRLLSENCKGERKLVALKHYLGCDAPPFESFAYGDSRHDLPVLNWVGRGVLVKSRETVTIRGNDALPAAGERA